MTNEANSTAVEAAENASDGAATERGVAGGRGNAGYTVFVSNLPFNVTADELREKFKHVSLYVSPLPLVCVMFTPLMYHYYILTPCVCHFHPSCMLLLPLVSVNVTPLVCLYYPLCVSLSLLLYVIIACHYHPACMSLLPLHVSLSPPLVCHYYPSTEGKIVLNKCSHTCQHKIKKVQLI